MISIGDLWRTLLSLLPSEERAKPSLAAFEEMISFTDGRGRNVGYSLYYSLLEKYENDFARVQSILEDMLGVRFAGIAAPVTLEPTTLSFRTRSGAFYFGEHELDNHAMSSDMVETVWCDPQVQATPEAVRAVKAATHIIYCPGSLYGSLLSNFLPLGVNEALRTSNAIKVLVTNLVSTRSETHNFAPIDYWDVLSRYTELKKPLDILICPDISRAVFEQQYPQIAARYGWEHAHFLGWETTETREMEKKGLRVVREEIFLVDEEQRLRHDFSRLADVFRQELNY